MVEAPEKIWAYANFDGVVTDHLWTDTPDSGTEYLRSDIAERQIAELRAKIADDGRPFMIMKQRVEAAEADKARLSEALERLANWPSGGNTSGQTNMQKFARAALSGSGAGGWREAETDLPPIDQVVIIRYPSGYDGGDVFAWGARVDDGEGWTWGVKTGYDASVRPSENATWNGVETDDEYLVTHWMPLPAAPTATGGR